MTPKNETPEARKRLAARGAAMPDGSFPIPNEEYLRKAIQAFGRANPSKRAAVKAHIIRRAKALGRTDLIPESWRMTESGAGTGSILLVSSRVYPSLERKPGKQNWVDKAGGLPSYIERIAKHLHYEKGMSISRAIATAVNAVKKMCATGDLNYSGKQNVNAKSRAEACNAVRQWEQKKGKSRVSATEIRGRKLGDLEFAEIISEVGWDRLDLVQRAPGASGSNRPFDESKYLRNPGTGQFASKFTPAELLAGRRVVEGGITNLQVGQTFDLPGNVGWVMRTAGGYLIQGPANMRVGVKTLSEAVEAAANLMAGKLSRVGEPTK